MSASRVRKGDHGPASNQAGRAMVPVADQPEIGGPNSGPVHVFPTPKDLDRRLSFVDGQGLELLRLVAVVSIKPPLRARRFVNQD